MRRYFRADPKDIPGMLKGDPEWVFSATLGRKTEAEVFGFTLKSMEGTGDDGKAVRTELTATFEDNWDFKSLDGKNIHASRDDFQDPDKANVAVQIEICEFFIDKDGLKKLAMKDTELKYKKFELVLQSVKYGECDDCPKPPPPANGEEQPEPKDVTESTCGCKPKDTNSSKSDQKQQQNQQNAKEEPESDPDLPPGSDAVLSITGYFSFQFSGKKDGQVKVAFKDYQIDSAGDVSVGEIAAKFAYEPVDICFWAKFTGEGFSGCFDGDLLKSVTLAGQIDIGAKDTYSYGRLKIEISLKKGGLPIVIPFAPPVDTGLNAIGVMGEFGWNVALVDPNANSWEGASPVVASPGSYVMGLGLKVADRGGFCAAGGFGRVELGVPNKKDGVTDYQKKNTAISLSVVTQVTQSTDYLTLGGSIRYVIGSPELTGNLGVRLNIPEDGSVISIGRTEPQEGKKKKKNIWGGELTYVINDKEWKVHKHPDRQNALNGTVFGGWAVLKGDATISSANDDEARTDFPKGRFSGTIEAKHYINCAFPEGFRPFVGKGDRCSDSSAECVEFQKDSVNDCFRCAKETSNGIGFVVIDRIKLKASIGAEFDGEGFSGKLKFEFSASPLLLVRLPGADSFQKAQGTLRVTEASVELTRGKVVNLVGKGIVTIPSHEDSFDVNLNHSFSIE